MRLRAGLVIVGTTIAIFAAGLTAHASVQASSLACARPDGRVSASATASGVVYLGGRFTHVTDQRGVSQPRAGLAAIDLNTCDLLPWVADTNAPVNAVEVVGNTLYAGGDFTTVGGLARTRIAALDAATGAVLPFAHKVAKSVRALTFSATTLYAGGSFNSVDGVSRAKLAAFDLGSGELSSTWRPTASGSVRTLTPSASGERIYVGGSFGALDGDSAHPYMGAVNPVDGSLDTGFDPGAEFPILDLVADTRGVYAAGAGAGGHVLIWNPDGSLARPVYLTDGDVQAIAVDGDSLYIGGHFDNYCVGNTGFGSPLSCERPLPRKKLFEISLASGDLTDWAPRVNSPLGVFTATVDPASGSLCIGGDFTTIDSVRQPHFGVFAHTG